MAIPILFCTRSITIYFAIFRCLQTDLHQLTIPASCSSLLSINFENAEYHLAELERLLSSFPVLPTRTKNFHLMLPLERYLFCETWLCLRLYRKVVNEVNQMLSFLRGKACITTTLMSTLLDVASNKIPNSWKFKKMALDHHGRDLSEWLVISSKRYELLISYFTSPNLDDQVIDISAFVHADRFLQAVQLHLSQKLYRNSNNFMLQVEVCVAISRCKLYYSNLKLLFSPTHFQKHTCITFVYVQYIYKYLHFWCTKYLAFRFLSA